MTDIDLTILNGPRLTCERHGDQGRTVGIELQFSGTHPLAPMHRRYCMACWVDQLDASLCQLTEADQ